MKYGTAESPPSSSSAPCDTSAVTISLLSDCLRAGASAADGGLPQPGAGYLHGHHLIHCTVGGVPGTHHHHPLHQYADLSHNRAVVCADRGVAHPCLVLAVETAREAVVAAAGGRVEEGGSWHELSVRSIVSRHVPRGIC